jgi:beta-glucanase (GH16 family)
MCITPHYLNFPANQYLSIALSSTINSRLWTARYGVMSFKLEVLGKYLAPATHCIQTNSRNGTGAFDWTTDDPANSYVSNNELHIVPTLTLESTSITPEQLINGYTLNLTSDGTCTTTNNSSCATTSNSTTGIIINPVRSARLTTSGKKTITYGRVEVVAKMPKGDWLWPAIW